jgi:hypothetical protein
MAPADSTWTPHVHSRRFLRHSPQYSAVNLTLCNGTLTLRWEAVTWRKTRQGLIPGKAINLFLIARPWHDRVANTVLTVLVATLAERKLGHRRPTVRKISNGKIGYTCSMKLFSTIGRQAERLTWVDFMLYIVLRSSGMRRSVSGNSVPNRRFGITTLSCVLSQKSADHIYIAAKARNQAL